MVAISHCHTLLDVYQHRGYWIIPLKDMIIHNDFDLSTFLYPTSTVYIYLNLNPKHKGNKMLEKICVKVMLLLALISAMLVGCASKAKTGTMEFIANGEDFVRQGFFSKDGWSISFDHVYITLTDIKAYQTDPPYDPHEDGDNIEANITVNLGGPYTIDLAEGGSDTDPIFVGKVDDAPAGQYNAIAFKMVRVTSGDASGYSLVLIGTAEKEDEAIDFTISFETEYHFTCGEYVGDERKSILSSDGIADLEMTFHFDHIFGDINTPLDDPLNTDAPGFDPFAILAKGGVLDTDMADLATNMDAEAYQMLVDILPTLGHVGEGHCHYHH